MVNEFVLRNIYNNIEELSDPDLQYKVWIKAEIPDHISSYTELRCSLFDSNDYEGFITRDVKEFDLKEEFIHKLIELNVVLKGYEDKGKTELEIINDPVWRDISKVAKEVKTLWEKSTLYDRMAKLDDNNLLS